MPDSWEIGKAGEQLATNALALLGYRIITVGSTKTDGKYLHVDLFVTGGKTFWVEVKVRSQHLNDVWIASYDLFCMAEWCLVTNTPILIIFILGKELLSIWLPQALQVTYQKRKSKSRYIKRKELKSLGMVTNPTV